MYRPSVSLVITSYIIKTHIQGWEADTATAVFTQLLPLMECHQFLYAFILNFLVFSILKSLHI